MNKEKKQLNDMRAKKESFNLLPKKTRKQLIKMRAAKIYLEKVGKEISFELKKVFVFTKTSLDHDTSAKEIEKELYKQIQLNDIYTKKLSERLKIIENKVLLFSAKTNYFIKSKTQNDFDNYFKIIKDELRQFSKEEKIIKKEIEFEILHYKALHDAYEKELDKLHSIDVLSLGKSQVLEHKKEISEIQKADIENSKLLTEIDRISRKLFKLIDERNLFIDKMLQKQPLAQLLPINKLSNESLDNHNIKLNVNKIKQISNLKNDFLKKEINDFSLKINSLEEMIKNKNQFSLIEKYLKHLEKQKKLILNSFTKEINSYQNKNLLIEKKIKAIEQKNKNKEITSEQKKLLKLEINSLRIDHKQNITSLEEISKIEHDFLFLIKLLKNIKISYSNIKAKPPVSRSEKIDETNKPILFFNTSKIDSYNFPDGLIVERDRFLDLAFKTNDILSKINKNNSLILNDKTIARQLKEIRKQGNSFLKELNKIFTIAKNEIDFIKNSIASLLDSKLNQDQDFKLKIQKLKLKEQKVNSFLFHTEVLRSNLINLIKNKENFLSKTWKQTQSYSTNPQN